MINEQLRKRLKNARPSTTSAISMPAEVVE
jgi:hypothetical protein